MTTQELADFLISLSPERLAEVAAILEAHGNNPHKVGITTDSDPLPPDPTHPKP